MLNMLNSNGARECMVADHGFKTEIQGIEMSLSERLDEPMGTTAHIFKRRQTDGSDRALQCSEFPSVSVRM